MLEQLTPDRPVLNLGSVKPQWEGSIKLFFSHHLASLGLDCGNIDTRRDNGLSHSEVDNWHQDNGYGEKSPVMAVWSDVCPTEFKFIKTKDIYIPKAGDLVLFHNDYVRHRRNYVYVEGSQRVFVRMWGVCER